MLRQPTSKSNQSHISVNDARADAECAPAAAPPSAGAPPPLASVPIRDPGLRVRLNPPLRQSHSRARARTSCPSPAAAPSTLRRCCAMSESTFTLTLFGVRATHRARANIECYRCHPSDSCCGSTQQLLTSSELPRDLSPPPGYLRVQRNDALHLRRGPLTCAGAMQSDHHVYELQ